MNPAKHEEHSLGSEALHVAQGNAQLTPHVPLSVIKYLSRHLVHLVAEMHVLQFKGQARQAPLFNINCSPHSRQVEGSPFAQFLQVSMH